MNHPYKLIRKSVATLMRGKLPYNPEGRELKAINKLVASISKYGMLEPLKVSGNKLGDGHRRLAAVRELGWTHVMCLDYGRAFDAGDLYRLLNDRDTNRQITGAEALQQLTMCDYDTSLLPSSMKSDADRMLKELPRTTVKKMAESGRSFTFYKDIRTSVRKISSKHRMELNVAVRNLIINENKQVLKLLSEDKGLSQMEYDKKAVSLIME